jgi:hypothetical protein
MPNAVKKRRAACDKAKANTNVTIALITTEDGGDNN